MIRIDLLDYKYDNFSNNQVNFDNATTVSQYWTINNLGFATNIVGGSGNNLIYPVTAKLTKGEQYEISITVSNYGGTGDIGFTIGGTDGTADMGFGTNVRRSSNGKTSYAFTASASDSLRIFAKNTASGEITASVTQRNGINWNDSVSGTLDVGDSDEFPLSMNFSVSDARNLNSRTGTYSKTFKIPATKNNNKILKSSYIEGSYIEGNTISNQKPCRLVVDNNLTLVGLLQLTAVGKSTEPLYYSCVFYGNNVDWASSLDNKLLKDLSVNSVEDGSGWDNLNSKGASTGVGLQANRDSIISTWDVDNAVYKTPYGGSQTASDKPIVYPIVGYGENNEGGSDGRLQLLKTRYDAIASGNSGNIGYSGWFNNGDAYPTPIPSMDFRPAIFVYDIIKQLFNQEKYTIVSTFIESDFFKGITMLLPNFKHNNVTQRIAENSFYGSFSGKAYVGSFPYTTPSILANQNYWPSLVIKWNGNGASGTNSFVVDDPSSMYSDSAGYFTIQEYGFYDINVSSIGGWLDSVCAGTSDRNEVDYIRIKCEVRTAGQTSWNNIGNAYGLPDDNGRIYYSCPAPPVADKPYDFEDLQIENQWLNKNDTIRFRLSYKMGHGNGGSRTIGWENYLYGGTGVTGIPTGGTSGSNGNISIVHKGENVEYGQTFDLKNVIDNESTQLGFLRGIIHAFNLQFTTDTVSRAVYIEPYNDFYKNQNEAIDWTYKVDQSLSQEDKWIQSDLKREVIFKYKTDSNDKVVEHRGLTYWDGILDEYPYREFLSSEFEVGKSVFENPFFAGSYNSRDGQTFAGSATVLQTPYRANLWGLCDSGAIPTQGSACRPDKGYNFLPRLVNYVKSATFNTSSPSRFTAAVQDWSSSDITVIIPGLSQTNTNPFLCYANSIDNATFTSSPRQPLSYASVTQGGYDATNNVISTPTAYKGLYQTYYQAMIEQLKSNPRIKTIYVNLKLSDITNLDLRKLVYIDGYYYRINRVVDYKPNNNEITKVELMLWLDKGYIPVDTSFNS